MSQALQKLRALTTSNEKGCWEWQRSCNSAGYGQLTVKGKYWTAHRYALSLTTTLPESAVVRHQCHNPKCCNPDHLLVGSQKDNYADSLEAYKAAAVRKRKAWRVGNTSFGTLRQAVELTGLTFSSFVKYTVDGQFDREAYKNGCAKVRKTPRNLSNF